MEKPLTPPKPTHVAISADVIVCGQFVWEYEGQNRAETRAGIEKRIKPLGLDSKVFLRYDNRTKEYHITFIADGTIEPTDAYRMDAYDEYDPFCPKYEVKEWIRRRLEAGDIYEDMWNIDVLNTEFEWCRS